MHTQFITHNDTHPPSCPHPLTPSTYSTVVGLKFTALTSGHFEEFRLYYRVATPSKQFKLNCAENLTYAKLPTTRYPKLSLINAENSCKSAFLIFGKGLK